VNSSFMIVMISLISLCVSHGSFLAYVPTYVHVILETNSEGYNVLMLYGIAELIYNEPGSD